MTLDRAKAEELSRPIESLGQLVEYFRWGEKPAERWRLGTEHEKLGIGARTLEPVPYDGERGIEAFLRRLAEVDGWTPVREDGHVVGLDRGPIGISLEPGGQVELNGQPLGTVHETCAEFHGHLRRVKEVAEPFDIAWLALGLHPFHRVEDLPRVPRERYRIMRQILPARGDLALEMMHATASVQVSFDYADEADMVTKFRTALAVTPLVAPLFANSPLAGGRPCGFVSRRLHVWTRTDPDRCGLLPFVFDPDFGYRRYAEWALDVPMFFVVRDGRYRSADGMTFRRFLDTAPAQERPTLLDFDRHLTTLFPHVRLKQILEVRCADSVPPPLTCALPALWKGLLYDADAGRDARELVRPLDARAREVLLEEVARSGLRAKGPDGPILPRVRELVDLAAEGLRRQDRRDTRGRDERRFLDPLYAQLERGLSPGEELLERWEKEWNHAPDRLIEHVRY